jgi:mannose-1-phosphate guanylyltransferase
MIKTPKNKLVVIQGLNNYIIAENDNVLMICSKDQEQQVKQFVEDATAMGERFS